MDALQTFYLQLHVLFGSHKHIYILAQCVYYKIKLQQHLMGIYSLLLTEYQAITL